MPGNQIAAQGGMGGAVGGAGMGGMNGMGMGMRQGMGGNMGAVNPNFNRMVMNSGPGPARATSRGQHSFHPYSR
jgi:RNA-binding protein Musashi